MTPLVIAGSLRSVQACKQNATRALIGAGYEDAPLRLWMPHFSGETSHRRSRYIGYSLIL